MLNIDSGKIYVASVSQPTNNRYEVGWQMFDQKHDSLFFTLPKLGVGSEKHFPTCDFVALQLSPALQSNVACAATAAAEKVR